MCVFDITVSKLIYILLKMAFVFPNKVDEKILELTVFRRFSIQHSKIQATTAKHQNGPLTKGGSGLDFYHKKVRAE